MEFTPELEQEFALLKAEVAELKQQKAELTLLNTRNKLEYAAINETYARCPGDRFDLSEVEDVLCSADDTYRGLQSGIDVSDGQRQANRIIIERAARSGLRWWLPAGVYEIDKPIRVRTSVHINLAGDAGKTFLKTASGDAIFDVQFPSTDRKSVFLHGLSLAASGTSACYLLKGFYINGVFAQGCHGVGETYRHKLFLLQYCNNVRLEDSVDLVNCTVARIQNSTNIRIINIHGRSTEIMPPGWSQNADHAFVNIEYCDDWSIDRADFAGYVHGLQWWGGDGFNVEAGGGSPIHWILPTADLLCTNGKITNVTARNQLMSGVWGSCGRDIIVDKFEFFECGDVGGDSECGDNVVFQNGLIRNCGWYTGGGNMGAFGLQRGIVFRNIRSIVTDSTIIHPEAGVNPNIPAGKPKYNHLFHILDYAGYRCLDITYENVKFITEQGVSTSWMYGDIASLKFIKDCEFKNFSLNIGGNRGYEREISDFTFELTQPVPLGVGLIAVSVGDSVAGIGTVDTTMTVGDEFDYEFPAVFGGGLVEVTIPKLVGEGIAGVPGKTEIRNGTIKVKPGVAPSDKNVVGITTFCFDSTGNQELYVENVKTYGCNIPINTKCTVDLPADSVPSLYIRNNTFDSELYVREESDEGARSNLIWENNTLPNTREINLSNALTGVKIINLTPTPTDLHSSVVRYGYLGSLLSEDNPASFSKATVTLHYSNNVNNAAENSYTITSRTGVIAFNHLKGLYALDQRSCQITIHESDVIDPGSPTGKPYLDVWMQMEAGFGSCIAEVSIFLQEWLNPALRVGELTPYGPAGLLRWAGNWGPPISWFPTTGRIWTKLFEVDPPYAAIPDNMWEVIRDPLSKRTNLYSKWPEEAQKALLYPRKRMNDASYGTAGATQMNAGNFDVAINSLYLGWEERMGLAFNTDFMDLIVAKLIERGKIT